MTTESSRCPGSGLRMVPVTYEIREIEPADRERNADQVARAIEEGDLDLAEHLQRLFADWEAKQGQMEERLVCPVCRSQHLVPTQAGRARFHRRILDGPSWDKVRQLRKEIAALEQELDRQLEALEPDDV